MELQEFIKHSLISITNGIGEANKELGNGNKFVMPAMGYGNEKGSIIFDIAVTASSESEKSKGGGLKISVVDFGGKVDNKITNESVSRIKFSIKPDTHIG